MKRRFLGKFERLLNSRLSSLLSPYNLKDLPIQSFRCKQSRTQNHQYQYHEHDH